MPPRKRSGKRRAPLRGECGLLFLNDDGVRPLLSPGPNDPRYTVFEAPGIWDLVRSEVWRDPLRDLWPPVGALAYDDLTEITKHRRPHRPYKPFRPGCPLLPVARWVERHSELHDLAPDPDEEFVTWSLEKCRQAVETDIANVEAFRSAKPRAAAEIAAELAAYVEDLGVLLSIVERNAEDLEAARAAWDAFEASRRPR